MDMLSAKRTKSTFLGNFEMDIKTTRNTPYHPCLDCHIGARQTASIYQQIELGFSFAGSAPSYL